MAQQTVVYKRGNRVERSPRDSVEALDHAECSSNIAMEHIACRCVMIISSES